MKRSQLTVTGFSCLRQTTNRMKGMETMRRALLVMICIAGAALAGCGNFEWFPSSSGGGGTTPSPPPPGGTLTDLQADTVTTFSPYTVAFANITSSTTTTSVSVSGDVSSMYIINGGTPTNVAGTVKANDTITVQNTSSNYGKNLTISTLLNVGGASAYYNGTTGSFIFLTKKGAPLNTANYSSDVVAVPVALPGSFVFPATITLDSTKTTALNSSIWINGSVAASGAQITSNQTLQLKHTTASTAATTSVTAVTLTSTSGGGTPYTVTYKSVTQ